MKKEKRKKRVFSIIWYSKTMVVEVK